MNDTPSRDLQTSWIGVLKTATLPFFGRLRSHIPQQITDLLWERKQVIFYGPPDTGKTFLATRLARQLTERVAA